MGTLTLNDAQQRRAQILTRLAAGQTDMEHASQLLALSKRQVCRLLLRFQSDGIASVVHANTGRAPVNRTQESVAAKVRSLCGPEGKYHDFNICHLHDILAESEGIQLARSTLERFLKTDGLRASKRAGSPVRRRRRERKDQEGQMLQIDASLHDWLEGRAPKMSLHGAIDDATGTVVYLRFHLTECQMGYLRLFRDVATTYGLPESYYHDRHTILRSPKAQTIDDELAGTQPMSELQRVLSALGVASIAALSPQAKGRVERLWQTLQDRLIKEMRLAGIGTLEAANAFLPTFLARFNPRFTVAAKDPATAWVELEADCDLGYYFAVRQERTVKNDHTLSYEGQCLQLVRGSGVANLAGKKVFVHITPEAAMHVYLGKQRLCYRPVEKATPAKPAAKPKEPAKASAPRRLTAGQRAYLHARA
jgi:transposase